MQTAREEGCLLWRKMQKMHRINDHKGSFCNFKVSRFVRHPSFISGSQCGWKIFEAKTVSETCWEEVETIVRSILVQRFKNNKVVVV